MFCMYLKVSSSCHNICTSIHLTSFYWICTSKNYATHFYQFTVSYFHYLLEPCRCWKEKTSISLESYIYYLLHDVKVPAPGHSFNFFINADLNVTIRTPDLNELPLFDFAMREVFYLLDVDSLLYLFTSVLLENQVLICSSSKFRCIHTRIACWICFLKKLLVPQIINI